MMFLWSFVILFHVTDLSYAECKYGTFGSSNDELCRQCYYTCKACLNGSTCAACGSKECDLCQNNCVSGDCYNAINCTECIDGFYVTQGFCVRCKNTGCKCNDNNSCDGCLPRRYGANCESICPNECSQCNGSVCIGCIHGKYGALCEINCSTDCVDGLCNFYDGVCTKGCKPGKFGLKCENECLQSCKGNVCNMTNGQCINGCKNGYFLNVDTCQRCPENCLNCNSTRYCSECDRGFYFDLKSAKCQKCNVRCLSCRDYNQCLICNRTYHWGSACQHDCTGCYSSCNQTNGCSIGCQVDYYSLYDDHKGGFECIRCPNSDRPKTCNSCTNGSFCNECKSGFWGRICEKHCINCVCDKDIGCICDDGYSPITKENDSFCIPCPDQCQRCSSNRSCDECKEGLYVSDINTCLSCSGNCKDAAVCNSRSGACSAGCAHGWWGEKCDKECSSTCLGCEQSGFYNCTSHESTCAEDNGSCLHGCQDSFWGSTCMDACNAGCKGSFCNQTTGLCINGCKSNYFGMQCSNACSANCLELQKNWTERVCDVQNGHCLQGCIVGWYGQLCSEECSKGCNRSICYQDDGKCTFGCSDGHDGSTCVKEQVLGIDSPKEEGNSAIIIGASAGAGSALVLFVAVVSLLIILRRRRRAVQEDTSKLSVSQEATTLENADEPTYSRIERKRDVKTAGSIALKNTAPDNNTNALNQACPDTLKYAKRNSKFRTQLHEEDACQVIREEEMLEETEFAGKSDPNTYYNTTGRRIPLDKLADYIQHKAVQETESEFHKLPSGLSTEKEYAVARRQNNILKNRYKFIYPYDDSRVVLKDGGNDYINASYIEGFNRAREYIGAMGPFEKGDVDIVPDFWRMIWQERCETIVMLTNLVENRQTKCKQYWPDPGTSETYGSLHVTCTTEDVYADFIVRSFTVTKDGETLRVRHLHFTAWPDKTVPDDVTCLIEFRQKVRSLHKEKTCPIIVHCSAGIGRTGTFIALDILTFEGEARGFIDIFGCVATIRYQRVNLVQTPEQYVYLHHSVVHSLTFNCQPIQGDMFIEHYRKLNEKTDRSTAIAKQYEKLQSSFPEQSLEESSLIQNKTLANKIRKGADLPGDGYRVILHENRKPGASDFINAAFVNGFRTRRKFIAAQTPLPATVVDFLSMVIQEKCSCIVMMDEQSLQDKVTSQL